ncbi:DUF5688 family protein [Sinanaerobacter sp. ZZT-01]|uniref:DUF5688 family protein n=1 Tax=Sinanaerobacter sp. ZZT-01 TaxID=3111540 RepID=UPI002D79C199|nr:DUF5688 family protein [Sinanaerobacter sp. ZZT-01]WRR93927.1 DUF5688 family protein [Sinanaerobacter sp. ZZT-01]
MNLMDYQQFLDAVCNQAKDYFPKEYQDAKVELNHMVKTNDQEMDGITIRREQDSLVPQIYLNGYFELYENGVSLNEILTDIAAQYFHRAVRSFENLPEDLSDYEQIKDRIVVQIINRDMNQMLLKEAFSKSIDHTDLAAVLKIPVHEDDHSSATIRVTKELMERWKLDSEVVYQDALKNTVKAYPAQITTLQSVIGEMMFPPSMFSNEVNWEMPEVCEMKSYEPYVLTTPSKQYGAATLLYPEVLQQISDNAQSNLFILPSSVHELLLMRDTGEVNAAELQAMVMGVNQEAVPPEEQLSDEVYYYDGKEHTLSMATVKEETAELKQRFQQNSDYAAFNQETGMEQEL